MVKSAAWPVQYKVLVVALADYQLRVRIVDAIADPDRSPEIKGSSLDRRKFTRRDLRSVDGSVAIGIDGELVIESGIAVMRT